MKTLSAIRGGAQTRMRAAVEAGKRGVLIVASGLLCMEPIPSAAAWTLPQSARIEHSQQPLVEADPDEVLGSIPATLFGFNIPWMNFQLGYWRNNEVRPEIIQWLKPFRGAVYRYPGGEVSNWFEWEKAVGPSASRADQYTKFGPRKAEFGFDEFLDFVKAVNGVPLVTVNVKGTKATHWDDTQAVRVNTKWVQHSIQREGSTAVGGRLEFCQDGHECPVQWWELGNELDWGKDAWSSERYVKRARAVGLAMKEVDPAIRLIAHTASSPWNKKRFVDGGAGEFDREVGQGLGDVVSGYAYHAYYDGISIPAANRHMENIINNVGALAGGQSPAIFITEHARWPNKPAVGDWKDVWGNTGNVGGAISAADYLLSQMVIPNVRAAMLHSLGARGPWQLFYLDSRNDRVYPNVVYWGLRVLRQGLLDESLRVRVSSPNTSGYRGGYDVRAVFMREKAGQRYSLMTVNRSNSEKRTRLVIPKWAGRSFNARQYYITDTDINAANAVGQKDRVVMRDRAVAIQFDAAGQATVKLPPFSVSSVVIGSN